MRGFSSVRKCLLLDDFLPWALVPTLKFFVSIFYLYYLFCLILTSLACLFRSLGCSTVIQKLFWRCCSIFWWIFDVFVGRHVISPSYSFTIFSNYPALSFWWSSILVSIVAASSYIASTSVKVFPVLHILSNICYLWTFCDSNIDKCQGTFRYFYLHFSNNWQCWTSFHFPVGCFYLLDIDIEFC